MSVTTLPAIELDGVFKTFGSTKALQDVSMTVGVGETRALIGGNGAGSRSASIPSRSSITLLWSVLPGLNFFPAAASLAYRTEYLAYRSSGWETVAS